MTETQISALLSRAESLLREAEKMVDRNSETYHHIGSALTAVSAAESYIVPAIDPDKLMCSCGHLGAPESVKFRVLMNANSIEEGN